MKDLYSILVKSIMNDRLWDLPIASEDASIKMVLIILTTRGYVWIVNNTTNMNIVGIITEHDVVKLTANLNGIKKAKELVQKEIVSCSKNDTIGDILEIIKQKNVRRIPVLDKGRLIGEITLRHIIEKIYSIMS